MFTKINVKFQYAISVMMLVVACICIKITFYFEKSQQLQYVLVICTVMYVFFLLITYLGKKIVSGEFDFSKSFFFVTISISILVIADTFFAVFIGEYFSILGYIYNFMRAVFIFYFFFRTIGPAFSAKKTFIKTTVLVLLLNGAGYFIQENYSKAYMNGNISSSLLSKIFPPVSILDYEDKLQIMFNEIEQKSAKN